MQDGYGEIINERGIIVKIYVINPNSDANFTRIIYQTAKEFASPGTEIICKSVPNAPSLIEDFADEILCGPGLIKVIKESDLAADAYVLACTCDVNICAIREATTKPVIGIGEISMMAAMTLGYKFSIIQMTRRSVPMKLRMIHSLGFTYRCASVRAMDDSIEGDLIDKITPVALEAVEKDGAEVIVLGCAALSGIDQEISKRIGVPVIDGIPYAIRFAEAHILTCMQTSKMGLFGPSIWR